MPKPRKPRANGQWTEARFWSFVRSNLRLLSRKWPPVFAALKNARREFGGDGRQKWEYQCALCGGWFKGTEAQVDHIVPCGSIQRVEDVGPFLTRLLVEADGLQVVCKTCHGQKTLDRRQKQA